jgi:hypothetical protein
MSFFIHQPKSRRRMNCYQCVAMKASELEEGQKDWQRMQVLKIIKLK